MQVKVEAKAERIGGTGSGQADTYPFFEVMTGSRP